MGCAGFIDENLGFRIKLNNNYNNNNYNNNYRNNNKQPKKNRATLWDELDEIARRKREENTEKDTGKISSDGYFKGKKLCGRVQVVESFPDFQVEEVNSFPDLKVQKVMICPNDIGQWEFVDSFPDFTIKYVNSFPDFTIQFVDSFPGLP